jgi:hypothetical protein
MKKRLYRAVSAGATTLTAKRLFSDYSPASFFDAGFANKRGRPPTLLGLLKKK